MERIFPLSGRSEGLCAKVGDLPEGVDPFPDLSRRLAMGYIDYQDRWVFPPKFRRAEAFSRGIARVQDADDKPYYYIDPTGKRVSDELVKQTQAGLTRVRRGRKWGFADPNTGRMVIEAKYDQVIDFSEGLAVALAYSTRRERAEPPVYRWTWVDYTGREVLALDAPFVPGYWPGVGPFHEGLSPVAQEITTSGAGGTVYKYGYIDRSGTMVIEPRFDRAGGFHDDRAEVCLAGKWGFIDHTGKMVIPTEYAEIGPFSGGLAAVRLTVEQAAAAGLPTDPSLAETMGLVPPGWWGYVDRSGKFVVPAQFRKAEPFSDGLAYVENDDFQGIIDIAGNVVFDLTVIWQ